MRVGELTISRSAMASFSSREPPTLYSSTRVSASSEIIESSWCLKATCMTSNTTTPSRANPTANARKFVKAIRYAALARHLCTIGHPVADAANRLDCVRLAALVQFRSQMADVRFDDVGLWVEMIVPHTFEQHRSSDDLTALIHQLLENSKLARLEDDGGAVATHFAPQQVDLDPAIFQARRLRLDRPAPTDRGDPRGQLGKREWFDQIVV